MSPLAPTPAKCHPGVTLYSVDFRNVLVMSCDFDASLHIQVRGWFPSSCAASDGEKIRRAGGPPNAKQNDNAGAKNAVVAEGNNETKKSN